MRRLLPFSLFAIAMSMPVAAAAEDPKAACVTSYGEAQRLRRDGKLTSARGHMRTCARDVCPGFIQRDCLEWLEEVGKVMPTVVLQARSAGRDLVDVKVLLDGAPLVARLDGKQVEVDPGEHTFRFEYGTEKPVEQTVLIREGEKSRAIEVTIGPEPAPLPQNGPGGPKTTAPPTTGPRPTPTMVYVLGGVGLAAIGSAVAFTLAGSSEKKSLKSGGGACAPFCSDDQVSGVETKFLIAQISIGLAVASLGTAAALFFTRPHVAPNAGTTGLSISPSLHGGAIHWSGSF